MSGEKIELLQLVNRTKEIFDIPSIDRFSDSIKSAVKSNDYEKYKMFCVAVNNDLSEDWIQKIYQYYFADRKEKKQDFTPKSLGDFVSLLAGNPNHIIDLCAGSGALTISKWASGYKGAFTLYEIDETTIYFLLFNIAIRNIEANVNLSDVIDGTINKSWKAIKGDKFSIIEEQVL